jgi:hypothetical protein
VIEPAITDYAYLLGESYAKTRLLQTRIDQMTEELESKAQTITNLSVKLAEAMKNG